MKAEKNKKTGKWDIQYRYTDWQGIRRKSMKRGFDTKREAEEWLREFLSVKAVDFNMLFEDFVNDIYYKDQATRLREHTMENKHYIIDLKILPYFGRKKMNEIKAGDIRKWQNMMISKGYAPTYLKTMNNQLSAIFNFAEKYYDLSTNPCKKAGSMKDMFSHISHASGVSMTSIILPMFLTRIVVKISVMIGKITKKEPLITELMLYNLVRNNDFDSSKAKKELGYKTRPFEETIYDEVEWLKSEKRIK